MKVVKVVILWHNAQLSVWHFSSALVFMVANKVVKVVKVDMSG